MKIKGMPIKYLDYLDMERYGVIHHAEPYQDDIYYVYIEDEDDELNIHEDEIDGELVKYAEIRLSTQVWLDKDD